MPSDTDNLKSVAMVMQLVHVLQPKASLKDKNKWKLRMLKAYAGDNLSLPDDWDRLPEKEKARRLDEIIQMFKS